MLRKRGGELPTTFNQSSVTDGSGKSIRMEAPLAKAIRSADGFIKGTYIWLFISICFIWGGASWIRKSSASMILDCSAGGCTLTIYTPYKYLPQNSSDGIPFKSKSKRSTKISFRRDQLVRADNVKWDPSSQQIVENYGLNSPTYASQQQQNDEGDDGEGEQKRPNKPWNQHKKKKQKKYKKNPAYQRNGAPDSDGNYDSYVIVLRDPLPPSFESDEDADPNESPSKRMQRQMASQHDLLSHDPNSLASLLAPFAVTEGSNRDLSTSMEYMIHPRDFNLGQTRRLARTSVSKINAYTKGRRASCIIRESRPVAWQGLVLLILGIFSFVLCLLLGQFWEEHDPTKVGSYRKRMAEIRKREEAKKARLRRNAARKPAARRPASGAGKAASSVSRGSTGSSVSRTSSTGSARLRPNAGANKGGNSWMGGGAAHGYTKRGY